MKTKYDVIIVGAGPAGSTSALKIAAKGYDVLLVDKDSFPRTKSCGDGLTRTATKILYDLGLKEELSIFKRTENTRITVKGKGSRNFKYPDHMTDPNYGLVIPRKELDYLLVKKAIEKGVFFMGDVLFDSLIYINQKAAGIRLKNGNTFYADIVIGADGATSNVAYQASLPITPIDKMGIGTRGYFKIAETDDTLQMFLPILDRSNKRVLPSYGWVFPVEKNIVNIGVGLIEQNEIYDIDTIFNMFMNTLKKKDSRFSNLQLQGTLMSGPMRFDFKPERTYAPGILLVGDAAGMINPFTGEGIGYALETGIHAANFYLELKKDPNEDFNDLSKYGDLLGSKYQGYFEAGTESINRYHLIWKVLKGTFQNDKPLFNAIRQATVFPEGVNESFFNYYTENVSDQISEHRGHIRSDMLSVGQGLIQMTREDWPFLSRLFNAGQITPGIPFRPSLLILIAGYSTQTNRNELTQLGMAVELGLAAAICHDSVSEEKNDDTTSSGNWGNMIAILVGDYLLSRSFEIISFYDQSYTKIISEGISKSNQGMILLKNKIQNKETISINDFLELYYLKNKYTFELCLQLGSMAKKSTKKETLILKEFGKHFGTAYFIVEDTLNYLKNKNTVSKTELNSISLGNHEMRLIEVLLKDQKGTPKEKERLSVNICQETAINEIKLAKKHLKNIEDIFVKTTLGNLCDLILEKNETITL
ncbi:geranylgeranyl reductase family protein [Flavivirga aquimarina]|uniref:Geranylgeranyl reductase family protein n=1 Tax=Flavivirga aquimarina TaxID=2027862 RepID=A0ABT8WFW0_9FLAO|nr:geranylgeranyl reductase family protein [Flavivirga aquimarina]MDO5972020.1 geranylgeranyl reductase family protein [Flavivirga aquimarina]